MNSTEKLIECLSAMTKEKFDYLPTKEDMAKLSDQLERIEYRLTRIEYISHGLEEELYY